MKIQNQYRQGDVLIERVAIIPGEAVQQNSSSKVILAFGEATGHSHDLETFVDPADWWKGNNEQFVKLKSHARVTHMEHATIELPPGSYRVTQQREYSPEEIRNVKD
jgi:hypothetical protein